MENNIHERTINFHARNKNLKVNLQEHLVFEMLLGRPVKYEEAVILSEENHLTKDYAEKILDRYSKRSSTRLDIRIDTILPVCEKMICEVGEVWYIKDPALKTKTPVYFTGGTFKEYFKDSEKRAAIGDPIYFSKKDYADYESSLMNFLNALDSFYTVSDIISKIDLMNRSYGCTDNVLLNMCRTSSESLDTILVELEGEEINEFLQYHDCLEMLY